MLKEKPALSRSEAINYFNYRKQKYGFQATVISDDQGRITRFNAGLPGSVHDARAWRKLDVFQDPARYFRPDEYLLADSAYPLNKYTIVPFKRPANSGLQLQHKIFNQRLSSLRVSIEHCIGRLKARFASLRGLPHRIRGADNKAACLKWIGSCVILHNLLMDLDDGVQARWALPDEDDEGTDGEGDLDADGEDDIGHSGRLRRNALMEVVIGEYNAQ